MIKVHKTLEIYPWHRGSAWAYFLTDCAQCHTYCNSGPKGRSSPLIST